VTVSCVTWAGLAFFAAVSTISAVDYFVAFWRKIERATSSRRVHDNEFILSRKKKDLPAAKNAG